MVLNRGRKSAASMSMVGVAEAPPLQPVENLSPEEQEVFRAIAAAVAPDHFQPGDIPLLEAYCRAVCLERRASRALAQHGEIRADGRPSAWLKVLGQAVATMTALSMRLRVSPQARRERAAVPKPLTFAERASMSRPPAWHDRVMSGLHQNKEIER
jgi:phage terminase small subunit